MRAYVWTYRVKSSWIDALQRAYSGTGDWARLFARSPDYAGAKLFRDGDDGHRFMTIDYFRTSAGRATLLADYGGEYAALDRKWSEAREEESFIGNAASPAGRTRTAPAPGARVDRLRFSIASCQQDEQGWYAAHRHMAAEDLDLVVFLGDYIYESSWGRDHVRKHEAGEPYTLEQYRNRYACYKSDPDLQRSHAAAPWLVTWDDHEVANVYANDRAEDLDPAFVARRAAAYRAYFEHMPLRPSVLRADGETRLYGTHAWGDLASLYVLDNSRPSRWCTVKRASQRGHGAAQPQEGQKSVGA